MKTTAIITVERFFKREDGMILVDFRYQNKPDKMDCNCRELFDGTTSRATAERNLKNTYFKTKTIIWEC